MWTDDLTSGGDRLTRVGDQLSGANVLAVRTRVRTRHLLLLLLLLLRRRRRLLGPHDHVVMIHGDVVGAHKGFQRCGAHGRRAHRPARGAGGVLL